MIDVSMTTFVDFAVKAGAPRVTVVREKIRQYQQEYHPVKDFWKPFREELVSNLKRGWDPDRLLGFAKAQDDEVRAKNYPDVAKGLKKWIGKREVKAYPVPEFRPWEFQDLRVRVNPELLVELDGERLLLKLYFKTTLLNKKIVQASLFLVDEVFEDIIKGGRSAILDLRSSQHYLGSGSADTTRMLLQSEASAFIHLWKALKGPER